LRPTPLIDFCNENTTYEHALRAKDPRWTRAATLFRLPWRTPRRSVVRIRRDGMKRPRGASHAHLADDRPERRFPLLPQDCDADTFTAVGVTRQRWQGPRDQARTRHQYPSIRREARSLDARFAWAARASLPRFAGGRRSPPWRLSDTRRHRCVWRENWRLLASLSLACVGAQGNGPVESHVPRPAREG
jgi:hypothetical protein